MKKFAILIALAIGPFLAACNDDAVSKLDASVTRVIAWTANKCDFVPDAPGVKDLLIKLDPTNILAVANAICEGVKTAAVAKGLPPAALFSSGEKKDDAEACKVVVEGVCITGVFVPKEGK